VPNARHLGKAAYLALGLEAAARVAAANGAPGAVVAFPDSFAPVRVRVRVEERQAGVRDHDVRALLDPRRGELRQRRGDHRFKVPEVR
jgi:hypothetical protein